MAPDAESEEANEQGRENHEAVGGDRAAGEVGEEGGRESHARQDDDVDLGMAEEPEEMQPEHGRAGAARLRNAIDDDAGWEKKARAEVAVGEEHGGGGEESAEGDDGERRADQPGPDGQGQAGEVHARAAAEEDGGEEIERRCHGGEAEESDGEEPEVCGRALSGASGGEGAEGRIGGPAGDGRALGNEEGREQNEEGRCGDPECGGVEAGQSHAGCADLSRQDEIGEGVLRHDGEDEEDHQRGVHGDEREVVLRTDDSVDWQGEVGPRAVQAHEEREQGSKNDGDEGESEIEAREGNGFGGEDAARLCGERRNGHRVPPGASALFALRAAVSRAASHVSNCAGDTTRRRACMR